MIIVNESALYFDNIPFRYVKFRFSSNTFICGKLKQVLKVLVVLLVCLFHELYTSYQRAKCCTLIFTVVNNERPLSF